MATFDLPRDHDLYQLVTVQADKRGNDEAKVIGVNVDEELLPGDDARRDEVLGQVYRFAHMLGVPVSIGKGHPR